MRIGQKTIFTAKDAKENEEKREGQGKAKDRTTDFFAKGKLE